MAYTNIDDPSAYFQTVLHSSANAATITNDGNSDLQPDLIWSKARGAGHNHGLYDSTRGVTKFLSSNATSAETTASSGFDLTSFNTDGFSTGNNQYNTICGGTTYVAWQWKANGGTTTSKSSATVSGNVTTPCVQQVNTDAGFSILTYTASTSYAGTETHLEHGLGAGPKLLIVKRRDTTANWAIYHPENGASSNAGYGYHFLNTNAAVATSSTYWLNTPAESNATLLAFGNNADTGADGGEYVCYAFAEKQGYSKFGGYIGNGTNNNGPFVYTGFKPALIMIKSTTSSGATYLWDTKRNTFNGADDTVNAAEADAETSNGIMTVDILSNGFKIRNTGANNGTNQSGTKYMYMAWAESPFTTSTGIPTTAR